jgi:hypothetical protein
VCPAHPASMDLLDHQAAQARTGPLPCRDRRVVMSQLVPTQLFGMQRRPITHARTAPARAHTTLTSTAPHGTPAQMHAARIAALVRRLRRSSLYAHAPGEIFVWRRVGSGNRFRSAGAQGSPGAAGAPGAPGGPCPHPTHPAHAHICAQCGADSGGRTDRLLDEVALI